jgi:hypothetical protein
VQWHTSIIPALRRLKKEAHKLEASQPGQRNEIFFYMEKKRGKTFHF